MCECVAQDASLLWPENKEVFIAAVQEAYLGKHAVAVTLTDEEMEEVVRVGTLRSQPMRGEVQDVTSRGAKQHLQLGSA